ncbi:MAG: TatD family hydrolase [PVC group bacterium]|nr:TatD family hydrolase [PVC group bacterium]
MTNLIDTHCHINFHQFDEDRKEVIQRARDAGVECMINIGADAETSQQSVDLSGEYEFIFSTAGVHPHYAADTGVDEIDLIEHLVKNEKVVAVGEIGLDYYNRSDPDKDIAKELKAIQQRVFASFLEVAKKTDLPVIIHSRDAGDDVLNILKNCFGSHVRGVMHCYSQDKVFLDRCLDLGLYVSFAGNITYKKAQALREVADYAPLDRILIETDAPFLAPQAVRGRRNEPAHVKIVAEEIARIKKIDLEVVSNQTSENARQLFEII